MKNNWTLTDSSQAVHTISIKGRKITVDGTVYKVKSNNWFVNLIDYQIDFPGNTCHLVVIGNNADLAVNGTFLGSGKTYEPVSSIPSWIYVLTGISIIGGWLFAGIAGIFIGFGCSIVYIKSSLEKNYRKVWIFFGIFFILTLLFFLLQLKLTDIL